jgi:biopolymer transport protein TolR
MAMGGGGSEGGLTSEINVTPMIDVLLVLLIIFMITLPLSRRDFETQVPPEQKAKQKQQQSSQIVLELRADGSYAINSKPVLLAQLDGELHQIYDQRPAKPAPNRKYSEVIEAMDIARGAGVQVIGFTPVEAQQGGGGN